MGKLWQKKSDLNKQVELFTVGDDYLLDCELVKYDCLGSISHAKMLGKIEILTHEEVNQIVSVLQQIIESDDFEIKVEQEDCHTAIENYLTEELGELGEKIHTARSRNDQCSRRFVFITKTKLRSVVIL